MNTISSDPVETLAAIQRQIITGPQGLDTAAERGREIGRIFHAERDRILPVVNAAANNAIDASLKRVLILNETVRAFATRIAPLRAFASVFGDVPLQGTDQVTVRYYPLQAAASQDFTNGDGTGGTGYQFGQGTNTQSATITVNKRKYQPIDYSSQDFRRQPALNVAQLGAIDAEKLGVDVFSDVWSVVTAANFGAAVKTVTPATITSDDIADIKGACTKSNWPDGGRSMIWDSDTYTALGKDPAYKLALNIGTEQVIQEGKLPRISGFTAYEVPNLPANGENLHGVAVFNSAIGVATAPVAPAPGVRALLVAYDVVTDAASGIAMNYRHWGDPNADRDKEVIECAYGYAVLVAAALKRIDHP
jgi:hypothetical protein